MTEKLSAESRLALVPFQFLDGFFYLAEGMGGPPVNVLWVFRIDGVELGCDRFREAVRRTVLRHPRVGCRVLSKRTWLGEQLSWAPRTTTYPELCTFHTPAEYPTSQAALSVEVARLMATRLDLLQGPVLKVHWYPGPERRGLLMLHFHRALGDARGAIVFLSDLFRYYSGERLSGESLSPTKPSRRSLLVLLGRHLQLRWRIARRDRSEAPDHLYEGSEIPKGELGFAFRQLDLRLFERVFAYARARGLTFNDLLLASWARSIERWKKERGKSCGALRFLVTQDVRINLVEEPFEQGSAPFPLWVVPATLPSRDELVTSIHEQVQKSKRDRVAEHRVQLTDTLGLPLAFTRRLLHRTKKRSKGTPSFMVSNIGRLRLDPADGVHLDGGRVTSAFVVARPAEVIGAFHTAVTVGDTLTMALGFFTDALTLPQAERLLELAEIELAGFADGSVGEAQPSSKR
jgi:NRPS condensation-like uncharacterized protein